VVNAAKFLLATLLLLVACGAPSQPQQSQPSAARLVAKCRFELMNAQAEADPSAPLINPVDYVEACMKADGYELALLRPGCGSLGATMDGRCYVQISN
jgi:hypothetical protein